MEEIDNKGIEQKNFKKIMKEPQQNLGPEQLKKITDGIRERTGVAITVETPRSPLAQHYESHKQTGIEQKNKAKTAATPEINTPNAGEPSGLMTDDFGAMGLQNVKINAGDIVLNEDVQTPDYEALIETIYPPTPDTSNLNNPDIGEEEVR